MTSVPPATVDDLLAERTHLLAALDALDVAVIVVTPQDGIISSNAVAREQLGFDPARLGADAFAVSGYEAFHEDGAPWPLEDRPHRVAARQGTTFTGELMELRREGRSRWLRVSARPLYRVGESAPYAAIGTFRDVTRQRAGQAALVESEVHFRLLAENASDLIARHTVDGVCTYASPAARELLGLEPEELLGDWSTTVPVHPDDIPTIAAALTRLVTDGEPYVLRYRVRHRDGRWLWMESVGRPVRDETGAVVEIQSATRDITARVEQENRLARLALTDSLTGLPNRAALTQFLEDLLAEGTAAALLYLDLDRFKVVNDSLGHNAGDELLRAVAGRLAGTCRDGDMVGRLGGDEFVVVAAGLDEAGAVTFADRVQRVVAAPVEVMGHELVMSASIGIVVTGADQPEQEAEPLLRDADVSMYRAKAKGRAQAVVWTEDLGTAVTHRFGLEGELRLGLERDELVVHYQPQVELSTGRIAGVEALVRWEHPTRGLLGPAEFLAVADHSGLVVELGRQVLVKAAATVAAWRHLPGHGDLRLSVNMSAQELLREGRLEETLGVLAAAGLPRDGLTVEVLESVLFDEEGAIGAALLAYSRAGIRLALDDFGTGSSSLLHLRQVPIGALKIDRAFVAGIGTSPQDEAIVRAVRSLTDDLGLGCVAEGVEEEGQRAWLADQGVRFAQGYLLHRPLPAAQVEALLLASGTSPGG